MKQFEIGIPLLAVAIAAAVVGFLLVQSWPFFNSISDAPEYALIGHMIIDGRGSQVYTPSSVEAARQQLFPGLRLRQLAVLSPPPGLVLLIPCGLIPPSALQATWMILSLILTIASLFLLKSAYALNFRGFLWLLATTGFFWPCLETLKIGQITPLLLFSLSLAAQLIKTGRTGAAMVALSVFALKPQYMLSLAVYLLGARRYKDLWAGSCAILILSAVSVCLLGVQPYNQYFHFLSQPGYFQTSMQAEISPTLRGQLLRLAGLSPPVVTFLSTAVLLCVLVFSYLLGRSSSRGKEQSPRDWFSLWLGAILPASMVSASLSHAYDMLLLVPSVVALIKSGIASRLPDWVTLLGMGSWLIFSLPVASEIHYRFILTGAWSVNPFFLIAAAYALLAFYLGWTNCQGSSGPIMPHAES